jgi:hypothetical protein
VFFDQLLCLTKPDTRIVGFEHFAQVPGQDFFGDDFDDATQGRVYCLENCCTDKATSCRFSTRLRAVTVISSSSVTLLYPLRCWAAPSSIAC